MAPVIGALRARPEAFRTSVCLTAQHRELLDQVLETFGIVPDFDLDLMRPEQSLYDVTASVLRGVESVLLDARPDAVLVHGDTTTTFAAALAAYYARTPAGHVEAGLRTHDKYRPFPEELNRRLADALCDYHYAPTEAAKENLLREGIAPDAVLVTGNTVIDALLEAASRPYSFEDPVLESAGRLRRLIVLTAHRRESFGAPLRAVFRAVRTLAERYEDVEFVYPVHPNPNVTCAAAEVLDGAPRVHRVPPLEYTPFAQLMKKAYLVLTDSGGIQEEAPSLGVPVLVLREKTERPEAIAAGTAKLVGTDEARIVREVSALLDDPARHRAMASAVNPYGDGHASRRIVDHLAQVMRA